MTFEEQFCPNNNNPHPFPISLTLRFTSEGLWPESRDEIPLRGEGCDTPGVYFALCREINPNLGCSVKISISRSCLSLFIRLSLGSSPNSELIDREKQPSLERVKTFNSWHGCKTRYSISIYKSRLKLILIKRSTVDGRAVSESNFSMFDRCPTILIRVRTLKRNTQYVVL